MDDKFDFDSDQYHSKSFFEKVRDDPAVPIGVVGLTSVVIYQLYNYKKKGDTKTSLYLINMRLLAQGTLLGTLTVALLHNLYKQGFSKLYNKKKEE